jgi:hypothetical protein
MVFRLRACSVHFKMCHTCDAKAISPEMVRTFANHEGNFTSESVPLQVDTLAGWARSWAGSPNPLVGPLSRSRS